MGGAEKGWGGVWLAIEERKGEEEEEDDGVLVESPATVLGPTQAGDLVLLQGELVVVGDLLVDADRLLRVNHNLLL